MSGWVTLVLVCEASPEPEKRTSHPYVKSPFSHLPKFPPILSSSSSPPNSMATHLLPSPASSPLSISPACMTVHLKPSSCCIGCFSVHFRPPKCSLQCYIVPARVIGRDCRLKASAKVMSPVLGDQDLNSSLDPSVPSTENNNGSDPSLGSSDNSLNDADDFEKPLQELLAEVKTLVSNGKKTDAISLLQANYEAVKEQLNEGFQSIEVAATLDIIALGFMVAGEDKLAASVLKRLNYVVDGLKDEKTILDVILRHMGSMYSSLGKYEKSSNMYQRAIKLLESSHGENSTYLVKPLLALVRNLTIKQKTSEALKYCHRAIKIVETRRGREALDLALPLSSLGNILLLERKPKEAESYFNRILNIYRASYGETDGRVGMALCSIARVKSAQGDVNEAVSLYQKAMQIVLDSGYMTLDDDVMEEMRIELVELLREAGRGTEAIEVLKECLVITEERKGKEHPSMVTQLINLADSYSHLKKYVEAERALRMCLQIMERTGNPDDPSISFPMLRLAITLYHLKRDKEAESLALQVLKIREAAFGKDSLPVGEALDCLVSIQMRIVVDDDEALLERTQRVLKIQETAFGAGSAELMPTLQKILFFLKKLGRKYEMPFIERRLSVLMDKHGDEENDVAVPELL
ncbi:Nephrocystin-3-like protein [Drosera capensis]